MNTNQDYIYLSSPFFPTQKQKFFLNKPEYLIVSIIFWLIWNQTEFCLITNLLENLKYNLIPIDFTRIRSRFICVRVAHFFSTAVRNFFFQVEQMRVVILLENFPISKHLWSVFLTVQFTILFSRLNYNLLKHDHQSNIIIKHNYSNSKLFFK